MPDILVVEDDENLNRGITFKNTTCLLLWTCLWIFGVHG